MLQFALIMLLNAAEPAVRVRAAPGAARVEVVATLPATVGADVAGDRLLRFTLIDGATGREGPAILGTFERSGETLRFRPRYPLSPGQRYRATFTPPGGRALTAEHVVPE